MATRKEIRGARYSYLRGLGYTAAEARRMRDWGSGRIDNSVRGKERELSRLRVAQRTEAQREQLQAIRAERRQERREPGTQDTHYTLRQRRDNWARWSGRRGFPNEFVRRVAAFNRSAGLGPFDSHGYRMLYYRYVEKMDEPEAARIVQDRYSLA